MQLELNKNPEKMTLGINYTTFWTFKVIFGVKNVEYQELLEICFACLFCR